MSGKSSIWTGGFIHLLFIELCFQFSMQCTSPIASNYAVDLGATVAFAGFVAGVNATASLIVRPFSGFITDNVAKKTLLLLSAVLFCVACTGCALSPTAEVMAVFRALYGVAFAFKSVLVVTFVAFVVPKEHVGEGVGWMSLASTLSNAVGPWIGSTVGLAVGYNNTFLMAAAMSGIGFVLVLLFKIPPEAQQVEDDRLARQAALPPEERKFKFSFREFFYVPALLPSLIDGLSNWVFGIISSFILMVSAQRGIENASLYFLMFSVAALVSRPYAGKLLDRTGYFKTILPLLLIATAAPVLLIFADNTVLVCLAGVVFGVGQSSVHSASQGQAAKIATPETMGRSINTLYIFPDIGMGFGPLVGGIVYGALGAGALYGSCVVVLVIDIIVVLLLKLTGRDPDAKRAKEADAREAAAAQADGDASDAA